MQSCLFEDSGSSFPFIPGATFVRYLRGRQTEWYCQGCQAFIVPVWIRKLDAVYPSCRNCLHDDLALLSTQIGEAHVVPVEVSQESIVAQAN